MAKEQVMKKHLHRGWIPVRLPKIIAMGPTVAYPQSRARELPAFDEVQRPQECTCELCCKSRMVDQATSGRWLASPNMAVRHLNRDIAGEKSRGNP